MRALETVFERLIRCLPGVGLTEMNAFLVSPPLVSLPLGFVRGKRQKLVCLGPTGPGALEPWGPSYNTMKWSQNNKGLSRWFIYEYVERFEILKLTQGKTMLKKLTFKLQNVSSSFKFPRKNFNCRSLG